MLCCCYLLHSGYCKTSEEALTYYGEQRTANGKGVTIPSQIRCEPCRASNSCLRPPSFLCTVGASPAALFLSALSLAAPPAALTADPVLSSVPGCTIARPQVRLLLRGVPPDEARRDGRDAAARPSAHELPAEAQEGEGRARRPAAVPDPGGRRGHLHLGQLLCQHLGEYAQGATLAPPSRVSLLPFFAMVPLPVLTHCDTCYLPALPCLPCSRTARRWRPTTTASSCR
eukprot:SAG22_NODE_155_length_17123_cov_37.528489_17_plen_229_part_00